MKCKECNGEVLMKCKTCSGEGFKFGNSKCETCSGEGVVPCSSCDGTGKVSLIKKIKSS